MMQWSQSRSKSTTPQPTLRSNSMGLVLRCNDTLLLRTVTPEQHLHPGHIYIYTAGNPTVVHRYVISKNNTSIIMKGDKNQVAEAINRTNINTKSSARTTTKTSYSCVVS